MIRNRRGVSRVVYRWLLAWVLPVGFVLSAGLGGVYYYRRYVQGNFHVVVAGQVYRSSQPSPQRLMEWTRRLGLKTVVNLRGRSRKVFYAAERRAAQAAGLEMIDVRFSAVRLPTRPALLQLIEVLQTARRPILLHCQAGADRAGVASVLAAMAIGGASYDEARKQLSWRFLHFDSSDRHIGGLLGQYEQYCRRRGIGTGGWEQFKRWARDVYVPYYYKVRIDCPDRVTVAAGQRHTVRVTVTNTSPRVIPAGDPDKTFTVASFSGSSLADSPDREFSRRVELPRHDIAPSNSVTLQVDLRAPDEPGRYLIHFDVVEEHRTWFARQGSPVPDCVMIVQPAAGTTRPSRAEAQVRSERPGRARASSLGGLLN